MLLAQKDTSQNHNEKNFLQSFFNVKEEDIDVTTLKGFFQDLFLRMNQVDISGMGAQLAFFFLLSFFPLLIFLVALLPYLNLNVDHVFNFIQQIMPSEVFLLMRGTLTEILTTHSGGGILSIGLIGTIWSASRGVNALIKTLNATYDSEERLGVINRAWALFFTLSLIVVIIIVLFVPIFGEKFTLQLFVYFGFEQFFSDFWHYVRWGLYPALVFIVLVAMYWVIPNTNPRLRFSSVILGAVFATLSWMVLNIGFSFYVNKFFNLRSTYGSITSVIVFMLWLYFTGIILIFGGVLNATMQKRRLAKKLKKAKN